MDPLKRGSRKHAGRRRFHVESPLRPEIRVFYPLHEGVLITETWFCAGGVRFAIADLDNLWERTGHIQKARRAALEVIVAEALLVLAVVAVMTLVHGPSTFLYGLAGLDFGLAFAFAGASAIRWPRPLELWAGYRGQRVCIYTGTDPVEFGKVVRAANRAVSHHRDPDD
jgi:hypothetical protein